MQLQKEVITGLDLQGLLTLAQSQYKGRDDTWMTWQKMRNKIIKTDSNGQLYMDHGYVYLIENLLARLTDNTGTPYYDTRKSGHKIDGVYGKNISNAIKQFEQDNNLLVDKNRGVAGPQVFAKIEELIDASRQPTSPGDTDAQSNVNQQDDNGTKENNSDTQNNTEDEKRNYTALQSFYNALDNAKKRKFEQFNRDLFIGNALKKAQLSTITTLSFTGFDMENIPDFVRKCTNLTELYVGTNNLKTLPSEIGKLTNLVKLHIDQSLWDSKQDEIKCIFENNSKITIYNDRFLEIHPNDQE